MAAESITLLKQLPRSSSGANELLQAQVTRELVFAVVGHVGSGTSKVAEKLQKLLQGEEEEKLPGGPYVVTVLKARREITEWASKNQLLGRAEELDSADDLETAKRLQDLGDEMRKQDHSAVACALVRRVRETRAHFQQQDPSKAETIIPDGTRRAYIIDAIRHPAEAYLLRSIYRNAFALIGVVCDERVRLDRLRKKYSDAGDKKAREFMLRDARAREKYGQRVSDAFQLADYFLDNSEQQYLEDNKTPNKAWDISEQLSRMVRIITHSNVVRPEMQETAMHAAYSAQLRSACLSRQVGAALIDSGGNLVSTGANEVPQAGGGVYGLGPDRSSRKKDSRCAYRQQEGDGKPFCSNTREQKRIIEELLELIPQLDGVRGKAREELVQTLRESRLGSVVESSRAVHAEMDALLSAARQGVSTVGTRMFVTTFPCHSCARHLVSAGVDEVQYIEPYPKSRALELHDDSITTRPHGWVPPSAPVGEETEETRKSGRRVLFRPFTGVAPRMYGRAFLKDRPLKSEVDGTLQIQDPDWGTAWDISKGSYVEQELLLFQRTGGGA